MAGLVLVPCRAARAADVILGSNATDRIKVEINEKSANASARSIQFSAKDQDIAFTPGAGAIDDPLTSRATAVVFSANECQCMTLAAAPVATPGWTQSPVQGTARKYRWKDTVSGSTAQVRGGRLTFKKKGAITYGLDSTPQGEVEVQIRLGAAADRFCARFAAPGDDSSTRYRAKTFASGTVACSTLPPACGGCDASQSGIELVSSTVLSGFQVDYYRNTAYPCAITGYQTFAIGYRQGSVATASQPLWVFMHGGGIGHFDSGGVARPDSQYMVEESLISLLYSPAGSLTDAGLISLIGQDPAIFRVLGVSMCDRDFYNGIGAIDANNPNRQSDGSLITTNGMLATQAAIRFTKSQFATSKYFLHGGSAGSIGAYGLAWSLQKLGDPPAGIVPDSGLLNQEWLGAVVAQGIPCPTAVAAGAPMTAAEMAAVTARLDPQVADIDNETHKLVASGRLTVPVLNLWTLGDPYYCGSTSMQCPLRDGSTVTMGSTDCMYEPMRATVAAQGPGSRSQNLRVCVEAGCAKHVPTRIAGTNTDPGSPADYNAAIMDWVHARLLDP